jgi:L-fucose isomerase-like protein
MSGKRELNVGFVTTVGARWPKELPKQRHADQSKWIAERYPEVNVVPADDLTVSAEDIDAAAKKFRSAEVDVLFIVIGAFGGDINAVALAEKLDVPILLWALPDPPFDGGRLMSNALVAATMNCAALKRMDYSVQFVYGAETDSRVRGEVDLFVRGHAALKKMRTTFLGLLGYRPTGFYSSTFDEMLIRKTFGLRMEAYDLSVLFNRAGQADADKVAADRAALESSISIGDVPEEHLDNHSRLYLAFKDIIAEQGLGAITLKCWPEMGDMRYTPCGVMSRLADEGFLIGCEGDVDATLSMLLAHYLTGTTPFMCDLINVDEEANSALFWHCGQAAGHLHDKSSPKEMLDHSLAGQGTVIEGTLKPGRVTVSLVVRIGGAYKLFFVTGEAVKTEKELRGVMSRVVLDKPVIDAVYAIANAGVPHHYSVVWADIGAELKYVAGLLGIETIEV